MALKEYEYNGGTYQLTEKDAERLGATPVGEKAKTPANKARGAANKADKSAAKSPTGPAEAPSGSDAGDGAE